MNEKNKTGLVIAFIVVMGLFLLFGGVTMSGANMNSDMMGNGWGNGSMGGLNWTWIPTLLTLGLGILLGWAIWGKQA